MIMQSNEEQLHSFVEFVGTRNIPQVTLCYLHRDRNILIQFPEVFVYFVYFSYFLIISIFDSSDLLNIIPC